MKLICLMLSISLLSGCDSQSVPSKNSDPPLAEAREKIGDADVATATAAKAKRDEFVAAMRVRLKELDAKCDQLNARSALAEGQAKVDLQKKLDETKIKRAAASKKLEELSEAGVDRWEKIKVGVVEAFDDVTKSFE